MKNWKITLSLLIVILLVNAFSLLILSAISDKDDLISVENNQNNPKTSAILTPKNAYAIVIGIENYQYLTDLSYCVDDATRINSFLRIGCNYKTDNIHLLLNSEATHSAIDNAFLQVQLNINPDDVFFFFFSGHGGNDGGSSHYICPQDCHPSVSSTNYYDTELDLQLDNINCAEKYIVIDACNSGGMIPESQTSGRYIMTACRNYEYSFETSELRNGIFTEYFDRSLNYATDSNGDDVISLEEQYSYTYSNTESYASGIGESQHPVQYDGISGQTVLYPSLASISFTPNGSELDYSFRVYGQGRLLTLNMTACSVGDNIVIETFDLTDDAITNTGFELYSGTIQLNPGENITGYEILAEIDGRSVKTIQETYGDTDGDGLFDIFEIKEGGGIDPRLSDSDSDRLDDYEEFYGTTNPIENDTDSDGMLDGYEVNNDLNPTNDDSDSDYDNDGLINILEYIFGTYANNPDSDGDEMTDGYEYLYDLELLSDDSGSDNDGDGLINIYEFQSGSMSNSSDSDNDEMPDLWEYTNDLNLTLNDASLDPDTDQLSNSDEYQYSTNPNLNDTDGDGWTDGEEVHIYNTDPLNPNSYPIINPGNELDIWIIVIIIGCSIGIPTFLVFGYVITKKSKKQKVIWKHKLPFEDKETFPVGIKGTVQSYQSEKPVQNQQDNLPTSLGDNKPIPDSNLDKIKKIKDIVLFQMPPPKPRDSPIGQRAVLIANSALKFITEGKSQAGFEGMMLALKLGVPEPENSLIKSLLIKLINKEIEMHEEQYINEKYDIKVICPKCKSLMSASIKFCTNCGEKLILHEK